MVHHAVFCLMAAFASRRMLVIDKTDEIFGLEKHFLPSQSKTYRKFNPRNSCTIFLEPLKVGCKISRQIFCNIVEI